MRQIANKIKPAKGFSEVIHVLLVALVPALVFVLARIRFVELALVLVLVAKWRMFAVRPRHWFANVRANSVDILIGVSIVLLMNQTTEASLQAAWAAGYLLWLLFIKPRSSVLWVGIQAMLCQFLALMSVYVVWGEKNTTLLTALVGGVCYLSARHFMSVFDEAMSRTIAYCWAYIGAAIAWVSGHWLLFYATIAQPVLLLSVVGYGMATLYYLQHTDRLSKNARRQIVVVLCAIVFVVIMFSDRSDKIIQ